MAVKVTVEGWIHERKDFAWGTVLVVTSDVRAKNASTGQWETVGKEYIDVTVTPDHLSAIGDDKLISVTGSFKATAYQKKDGTLGVQLKVNAQEVKPLAPRGTAAASAPEVPSSWTASAPF